MTKRKKIEERIAADEDEIKRQLEQQRRQREYNNQVDGRPRDSGAMLDALIREHGKKDQSGR